MKSCCLTGRYSDLRADVKHNVMFTNFKTKTNKKAHSTTRNAMAKTARKSLRKLRLG